MRKKVLPISNGSKILKPKSKSKSKPKYEYIVLLHKVCISDMSRARAEELVNRYNYEVVSNINTFGNLKFKNIIVPTTSEDSDIEVLYPTIESITEKLKGNLTVPQERKLKIFKLLDEL
jgi:hypothetical protein